MDIDKPNLFIEIQNSFFLFCVTECNENLDLKISSIKKVELDNKFEISNIISYSNIFKSEIKKIEDKINFTFDKINLIYRSDNLKCINISGSKNLAGSQLLEEDISFILNNLKKEVSDNNPNFNIIHIFNSKFNLDNNEIINLPIGLNGEHYNHHLSFYLLPKNEIKNLKTVFSKCSLQINKIIMKSFIESVCEFKKKSSNENFFQILIEKDKSYISLFENSSLIFLENFEFGTDIIKKDLSKMCKFNIDEIDKILNEINFDAYNGREDGEYLGKEYFTKNSYRKISIDHIKDIFLSRINEIINIIYNENSNLKFLVSEEKKVFCYIKDPSIFNSLKGHFNKSFLKKDNVFLKIAQDEHEKSFLTSAEIITNGWEKEAIPIIQTKKSIISKIFSVFFK